MAGPWSARGADTWSTGGTARRRRIGGSRRSSGTEMDAWARSAARGARQRRRGLRPCEKNVRSAGDRDATAGGVASDGSRHGRVWLRPEEAMRAIIRRMQET